MGDVTPPVLVCGIEPVDETLVSEYVRDGTVYRRARGKRKKAQYLLGADGVVGEHVRYAVVAAFGMRLVVPLEIVGLFVADDSVPAHASAAERVAPERAHVVARTHPVAFVEPQRRSELLHHAGVGGNGHVLVAHRPVALRRPPVQPVVEELLPAAKVRPPRCMLSHIHVWSEELLDGIVERLLRLLAPVVDGADVGIDGVAVFGSVYAKDERKHVLREVAPAGGLRIPFREVP